jgi:PAS domain-containing protein
MFDVEMRYLAVSQSFLSILEFPGSPIEVIGRSQYVRFPDTPSTWREFHARVLAGDEISHTEIHYRRREGRTD